MKASSAAALILIATAQERRLRRRQGQARTQALLPREIAPRGIGRMAVRAITASISASYHMLSTPAAPAPAAIARTAMALKDWIEMAGCNQSTQRVR